MVTYDREYFESPEGAGTTSLKGLSDLPWLLQSLAPRPDGKILDVGCGTGRLAEVIAERGSEVVGIDISEYAIARAKERCEGNEQLQFMCMSALDMDFQDCFDGTICYHFIEHLALPDARTLLKKMHDALKSDGKLVMGLPIDDSHLMRRAIHFMATLRGWKHLGHLESFSVQEIEKELVSAGFVIDEICRLSYFGMRVPGWVPQIPLIGLPTVCVDILATKKQASGNVL